MKKPGLLLLLLAGVIASLSVLWPFGPGGEEPVSLDVVPAITDRISIVWAGDTMLGDHGLPVLEERGYDWPLEGVAMLLDADVVIVNAETAITTTVDPLLPLKRFSYASDPLMVPALAEAGVDVLGLANNHALDQGPNGLADTNQHAEAFGLVTFGAGQDEGHAERPLLIRADGITIGVVGLGKNYGATVTASPQQAGTVPFSIGSIARGYELAKASGADVVVGYVHWGENYQSDPTAQQLSDAQKFADVGYDLVIGHGPHVFQMAAMVDSMPVLYSLGNFVFTTRGSLFTDDTGYGLVVRTDFTRDGLVDLTVTCIVTDNKKVDYQPRECDPDEADAVLAEVDLANLAVGP